MFSNAMNQHQKNIFDNTKSPMQHQESIQIKERLSMPNINQNQIEFLKKKRIQQISPHKNVEKESLTTRNSQSPKQYLHKEFERMSNFERVQTARDLYYILEKEPIFQPKQKLKPVTSESMFRTQSLDYQFHNGESKILNKIREYQSMSQVQIQKVGVNEVNEELKLQLNDITPKQNQRKLLFSQAINRAGFQSSRNQESRNIGFPKFEKSTQFTDNLTRNSGFKSIWRDSSMDQATRAQIIAKLKEQKQEQEQIRKEVRSQQRSQKAQRIKSLMQKLSIQSNDISKNLKFQYLPIQQIENELKDISTLKHYINCVIKVQSFVRMLIQRCKYLKVKKYYKSQVAYLQGFFRARYLYRNFKQNFEIKRTRAVLVIQRYARGYLVRKKNLIETRRLSRFKQNIEFLFEMTERQKAIQLKEDQEELERLRVLRLQEEERERQLENERQINLKKEQLTAKSPNINRNKSINAQKLKANSRHSIAISFKRNRNEVQSMFIQEGQSLKLLPNEEIIDQLEEAFSSQKKKSEEVMLQNTQKDSQNVIKEQPDREEEDCIEGKLRIQPKHDHSFFEYAYNKEEDQPLTYDDLRRYESQKNLPNYMKETASRKCRELELDSEKTQMLKKKNQLPVQPLTSRLEIEQIIGLANEDRISSGSSKSQRSKTNQSGSRNRLSNQKSKFHQEDQKNSAQKSRVSSQQNSKQSERRNQVNQETLVEDHFGQQQQNKVKQITFLQNFESSSDEDSIQMVQQDHDQVNGFKQIGALQLQIKSKSEMKPVSNQLSLQNFEIKKRNMGLQTDDQVQVQQPPVKIEQTSQEIQVEIIPSKYNYLSTSKQLTVDKLCKEEAKQIDKSILTRQARKKEIRSNFFFDRLVYKSEIYEKDPYRFKSHLVHEQEPFVSETPAEILTESFYTPNNLFYIFNHGSVPNIFEEDFSLYIMGQVHRQLRLPIAELKSKFKTVNISATLKCAANRKSEFDKVKFVDQGNQLNTKFGVGAIGTALWTGVRLRDILKYAQIDLKKSKFIEFYGDDIVHNTQDRNYSVALTVKDCMNKKSDIILAFAMNGEPLSRDHGFPLRLICPGMIGAKSVKWLSRILVIDTDSPSHFHNYDFKVFPKNIDSSNVGQNWLLQPPLTHLNLDSFFTNLQNNDVVPSDRRFVIKGLAIAGFGLQIVRVDISFDEGQTWNQCRLINFKPKQAQEIDESSQKWEWTPWEYVVEDGLKQETWVMVRTFDECYNTQPENIIIKLNMLSGIKFVKKDNDQQVPSSETKLLEKKTVIADALEKDLKKNIVSDNMDSNNSKKRWQKQQDKVPPSSFEQKQTSDNYPNGNRKQNLIEEPVNRRDYDRTIQNEDPQKLCDEALDMFMRGSYSRNILSKQDHLMLQTKQDDFNERFRNEMAGNMGMMGSEDLEEDVEEDMDQVNPLQQIAAAGVKNFQSQLSSNNMDHEMHKEMLIQKRNLMMKIRQNDSEYQKYDFRNEGYDGQLIEKKMRKGQEEKFQQRVEKREHKQASKHQRVLNKCVQCFYQEGKFEKDYFIHESENCYLALPIKTTPVTPFGQDPLSHIVLSPKQHFVNLIEVDEQIQNEIRNYQKSLVQFYKEAYNMSLVFIETSIQSENYLPHCQIDCVGIPNDLEMEFDLEVYFKKSLMEDDSEWGQHKKIIDTKPKQGMIWKCLPSSGQFNYVHIDFEGEGGFAHIIDDPKKYNSTKALEVIAGAIGHEMVNLSVPLRKEKAYQFAKEIRKKYYQYDWTRTHNN
eukprot:403331416